MIHSYTQYYSPWGTLWHHNINKYACYRHQNAYKHYILYHNNMLLLPNSMLWTSFRKGGHATSTQPYLPLSFISAIFCSYSHLLQNLIDDIATEYQSSHLKDPLKCWHTSNTLHSVAFWRHLHSYWSEQLQAYVTFTVHSFFQCCFKSSHNGISSLNIQ